VAEWKKKPAQKKMHRQTAQFEPLLFNAKHMNQSKNNVASINQKTM
jgi:hypothetical protein